MNSFVTIVYYYAQKGEEVAEEEKQSRPCHDAPDSTSNYFDYRHEPQQPGFYLGFGIKHRALRELYRHSTT